LGNIEIDDKVSYINYRSGHLKTRAT